MTPDLAEKLRLWRQEHGATDVPLETFLQDRLGHLAVPTGTNEPPPTPSQPLASRIANWANPPGTPLRAVTDYLANTALAPMRPGYDSQQAAIDLQNAPGWSKILMGLPVGAPVGSLAGTAGKGVLTQAGTTLGRAIETGGVSAGIPKAAETVAARAPKKPPFVARAERLGEEGLLPPEVVKEVDAIIQDVRSGKDLLPNITKPTNEYEIEAKAWRIYGLSHPDMPITSPAASEALGPAVKAAQATEGVAKEPWQMTKAEFVDTVNSSLASSKLTGKAKADAVMRIASELGGINPTLRDIGHKAAVENAVSEGKAVPANVLADYPELIHQAPVGAEAKAVSESVQQGPHGAAPTGATAAADSSGIPPTPGSAVPPAKPPIEPPVTTGVVPPGEPFAANIRLAKYPEDLRSTIKEWADANPDAVQAARRGVRSEAQVLEDAKNLVDEVGGDFARLQRRWKAGDAWNAEEITAIRGTLRSKTQAVVDAAKVAADADSSANQMKLLSALEEQARVQEIVHGITAESGRALRSFRQQAFDAVQSNDTAKMEELLKRLGGRAKTAEVAKALRDLDVNNPAAVNDFIRTILKPKAWDYITEIYYNSILSGPKTHIINGLSNMITTALSPVERGAAAVVEHGLAPLQDRQVERFFSEVSADTFGAIQGIQEGLQNAAYTMKNGFSPAQASKWEFRPRAFQGTIGRVINAPSTALEAADALNRSINYRAAFNATVIRQAKKEGWTGQELLNRIADLKASPSVGILKEADRIAEYRLFRQEPGEVMAKFMALRDSYPAFRFVVPFIRTPGNLLKFGLERTPAGLFNPKLWRNIASKNPEASDQIGRIFLGSSVAAFFAWQIAEGNLEITGAAPTSAAERDRFYREGKQPFAVRVGDTWIQFQRVEPLNQSLSQVAVVAEAVRDKDSTVEEKASHAVLTIGENLVSQTYATSIADLINALSQPERYGGQYLTRQITGFVPASSALRTGAQLADTTVRKPGTLGESIEVGIPSASRNVPPSLTAFGEEVKRQSPPISPILFSQAKESPVDTELARLGIEVGFIGDSIEGIKLTREQRQRYQEVAGKLVKIALDSLVQSPQYKATTDAEKEKGLTHVIEFARDKARAQVKQEFGLRKGMMPQNQPAMGATPAPMATSQTTTESRLEQWRREHATPVGAGR